MPRVDPTTVVLLVRHGMTPTTGRILPGRSAGVHLSDDGRRQAETAAERIAKLRTVTAIYASPLERARETAAPSARARGLRVRIEPELTEVDVGDWTRKSIAPLRKRPEWDIVQRCPSAFRFPGGESLAEMQFRMTSAVARLVARHPASTLVLVSHADPIKSVVAHALGVHLDLFQRIAIGTASITVIAYRRTGASVLTVNSVGGDLAGVGLG